MVGRLHPIKDPGTVLRGFERIAVERSGARLYLYYLNDDLLPELRRQVEQSPILAPRVEFRGPAAYEQMAAIYSSADFLLQASLREFSGCAVLEAMSCGVVPVISDIPSFHRMTAGGCFGSLFPVGDADALAQAVLTIWPDQHAERSLSVRHHFQQALSFPSLAGELESIYEDAIRQATLASRKGLPE
jgi:glycosyltransferase involved in cell wall biosynthesis